MSGLTIESLRAVFDRFSSENAWEEKKRIDAGVCLYLEINDLLRKTLPSTVRINYIYSYNQYVAIALELYGYKSKKRRKFINVFFDKDKIHNNYKAYLLAANKTFAFFPDGILLHDAVFPYFKSIEEAVNDITKSVIRYIITKGEL